MKKLLSALLASALTLSLLAGCGGGNGTAGSNPPANGSNPGGSGTTAAADLKGDLVFAIWDNNLLEYIEANDMEAKFQETYPNINVEVEKIKDDSEYWNSMKMRASANQLPDVMFNKPFTLSRFQDYLLDLSDTEACKNNTLAQGYALNGKVLGIPMTAGYEYVYYWKDMFQEAGVQVPTTWEELKDVAKKLQDYYGAKDPLGMSKDQVTNLFGQKKAAITALGDWGLQDISGAADSTDQLGTFYLPVRESTSEPFRYIVQGDSFMGVTTHSKNPEAAKAFVEWFYSEAWYPGYINYVSSASSMSNFPKDKDPILAEADAAQPDGEMVMYDGGGDDFTALQNETTFDYKKLGAQMLTNGFDLDAALADLDAKWTAARAKLGIQ